MVRLFLKIVSFVAVVGTVAAVQAQPVTLAWTPSLEDPQLAVALDKKLWSGIEVKATAFPTGREAMEAMLGGQADFAAAAELPAVVGAMRGQKFKILAVLSRYKANRILATTKLDLRSVADLAGRKVASTTGTNSDFALAWELKKAGVKAEIVNVSPPDTVPALSRGDVDAAYTFPAFTDQARRVLGERYRELMTPAYVTTLVLLASTDVIEKRPQVVAAFMAGLMKADAVVAADPSAAQEAVVHVVGGVLKLDSVKANWPRSRAAVADGRGRQVGQGARPDQERRTDGGAVPQLHRRRTAEGRGARSREAAIAEAALLRGRLPVFPVCRSLRQRGGPCW